MTHQTVKFPVMMFCCWRIHDEQEMLQIPNISQQLCAKYYVHKTLREKD